MRLILQLKHMLVASLMVGHAAMGLAQGVPAINAEAAAALERMGTYLRTLKSFEIQSITTIDDFLDNGQKVQFGGTTELKVRRPDRMHVDISNDRRQRQFYYDGKTVTVYGPRVKYYAVVPAPATLAEVVETLGSKYGIEIPLADLFYWGTDKARTGDIKSSENLGMATVDGIPCDHYAFRQEGVDWQVWIQKGKTPLPRKLVITTTSETAQPQYTAVMRWKIETQFGDKTFTFVPPAGVHRIVMQTADGKTETTSK